MLDIPLKLIPFETEPNPIQHQAGTLRFSAHRLATRVEPGILNVENAKYVLKTITRATNACHDGSVHAMVTGPVNKGVINDAGVAFSGHTEYIAELTGGSPVMMLAAPGLRVALVTTHLPLANVCTAITRQRIRTVLRILYQDLKNRFAIDNPRILVCGLNPHAGENGHLGREELDIIEPALESLRSQGMQVTGPLPADTLFTAKYLQYCDVVLSMYHDQGLPVLKYMGFGQAVNVTLGLPIIRTSVDHGTALDLAGSANIDTGSLEAAIHMAIEMSRNRLRRSEFDDALGG